MSLRKTSIKGCKVLVTGADGFIGSHLCEALVFAGAEVTGLAYYNSLGSYGWLDHLNDQVKSSVDVVLGDIRDQTLIQSLVRGKELVFHLAALVGIPFSYHATELYVSTNVYGTLNILQACRNEDVRRVFITSTSEVYGTAQYVPIDELHPLCAQSPYAATKIAADKLAESFRRSFGTPVSIVRPFNTYGPRQSARAIIPTIISQLIQGSKEIKLGDLTPTRDFNYVRDTVGGFIAIAEYDSTIGEEVNIATGEEYSVGCVAQEIISQLDATAEIVCDSVRFRPQESEVQRLLGSNQKIFELTGWTPAYNLSRGISETIKWFLEKNHLDLYKSRIYNI